MTIQQYLDKVNVLYKTGNAREHSYRGDLQNLIMAILPEILVTNEPARVACGAPDYVLTKKDIPVGYIEAKDIGVDLGSKTLKEQFDRYKSGLSNLIFTDYMDFHFYKDGELTTTIAIAKLENGVIMPQSQHFEQFKHLIENFATTVSQTIKSPSKLAQMMAGKARLMADVIEKSLNKDDELGERSNIKSQMLSFQSLLIHDIDNKGFSDIYSQTIAYGMFAARYHDPTLDDFSRQEAAHLIPKSNPFLRKLFHDIAGYDLDDRLIWIVDELVNIFLASDVSDIMKNFGKSTKQEDPIVHFYETFLGEYNPALRKARGVWYTPEPVVNFIVRAVDDILKKDFNLPQGLADSSKIKVKAKTAVADKRTASGYREYEREVHKVQILDPATGTGTFLSEVVKHIYKKFEGQQGIWSKYVKNDLIPRLNGFELLMASYAMAHLKMDILLTETGYKTDDDQRFRIFLTNSLEEAHPDSGTLFSSWLSEEANQANSIKKDSPVMVVIGNPPYSVSSTNKSDWIEKLVLDYKKDLKEKNKQPLSDDYIKFIRFGQHFIDKNNEGVLAYISNNSFIDGIIHRQMRKNLLESFDEIYILDLHGNSRIKEVSPDGSIDKNVFDIMAGVSINIFVKTSKKKKNELSKVNHFDLFGKREFKYDFLKSNNIKTIKWNDLKRDAPTYLLVNQDLSTKPEYDKGFSINELFINANSGLATEFDELVIQDSRKNAEDILEDLSTLEVEDVMDKYQFKEKKLKKVLNAKSDINKNKATIYPILYRPFDIKYCIYTGFSNGIMGRPRNTTMQHFIKGENIGIIVSRTVYGSYDWNDIQITNSITEKGIMAMRVGNAAIICPLYVYPNNSEQQKIAINEKRKPNLKLEIVNKFEQLLGIKYTEEKEININTFSPIDILDYIYCILHSPSYKKKYQDFLKMDFPRVPFPKNKKLFLKMTKLGSELRKIHLLESDTVEKYITQYPEDGDNVIENPNYKDGCVHINRNQYFANVPELAWNLFIGGYQPAQKWLKDRKKCELNFEDILHYQKIIVALSETDRIMKEIDKIEI